jgi:predicted  nucleic acid-binding Zn-ribbon protein
VDKRRTHDLQELALKADPFTQLILLDVQSVDSTLSQLAHRKKTLPQLAEIAALGARRAELDGRRVELSTRVSDLSGHQRRLDADVEQVRARKQRNQQRLDSGAVGSPKDLANLQHELVALDRRISTLEDEELEYMEQVEEKQAELDAVLAQLTDLEGELAQQMSERDAAVGEIDDAAAQSLEERERLAGDLPAPLLTSYERVRAAHGGVGAAALVRRQCQGCRLQLNAGDIAELAKAPADEVLRCPECDRILVRTAESGL